MILEGGERELFQRTGATSEKADFLGLIKWQDFKKEPGACRALKVIPSTLNCIQKPIGSQLAEYILLF